MDRAREPARPRWILAPRYVPGAVATLRPVPKARALLRLARGSFNYSVLGATGFEVLAGLVDACDCYRFDYGDLEDAVATLGELAAARGSAVEACP